MPATGEGQRWRLALAILAFAVLAPLALVALPFAALVAAARPGAAKEWAAVALAGGVGGLLVLSPTTGLDDALTRAWIVAVSVGFAAGAALRPNGFWSLALRACLYAGAAVSGLGRVVAGPTVWDELYWEATRAASAAVRPVVQLVPRAYPGFEPAVRLLAGGRPLWLVVETLAALALAWQCHTLVSRTPLGPPLLGLGARRRARQTPPTPRTAAAPAAPAAPA